MESATENNRHPCIAWVVRVKTCGKSARLYVVIYMMGKPYLEQGKVGTCRSFVPVKRAGVPQR